MMFLEFFVWGAWFVTLSTYLSEIDFSGSQIGYTFLTNNIGAILSPFFIGMIADRYFQSEKVMGILHLIGGAVIFFASGITEVMALIFGLLLYNICYMPTIALANAVSFNQMKEPAKQFPKIRVWGTIGWIIAGLLITFIQLNFFENIEQSPVPMKMAAIGSIILGIYAFTLPNTPPRNVGKDVSIGDILGIKALKLLKERSFLIFVVSSMLICIPLAFYFNFTNLYLNDLGMMGAAAKQSMGQMSEVLFMILMPWFFVRLGVKRMLLVGIASWVLRYFLFASGNIGAGIWMIYLGILLHGLCYDFFFVSGQIYVDKKASRDIRASAQGLITLVTYGIGNGLGSIVSGKIVDYCTIEGVRQWSTIWWIPAIFAAAVGLLFAFTFKDHKVNETKLQNAKA